MSCLRRLQKPSAPSLRSSLAAPKPNYINYRGNGMTIAKVADLLVYYPVSAQAQLPAYLPISLADKSCSRIAVVGCVSRRAERILYRHEDCNSHRKSNRHPTKVLNETHCCHRRRHSSEDCDDGRDSLPDTRSPIVRPPPRVAGHQSLDGQTRKVVRHAKEGSVARDRIAHSSILAEWAQPSHWSKSLESRLPPRVSYAAISTKIGALYRAAAQAAPAQPPELPADC